MDEKYDELNNEMVQKANKRLLPKLDGSSELDETKIIAVPLFSSEAKKLEKICKEEFVSINEMINNFINNKINTYDESGLECESCGKYIKEKEKYYIVEGSISTYEKYGCSIIENKESAWTDKLLCMKCKGQEDKQKEIDDAKVPNHKREQVKEEYFYKTIKEIEAGEK